MSNTYGVYSDSIAAPATFLPAVQFTSTAITSGSIPASATVGAGETYLATSGATALTLPTAASVWAAMNAIAPNMNNVAYYLRIINTNGGTLTLTAGTGNTITGTATLVTNSTRDFLVTITGLNTVTYQSVGTGTTS